MTIHFYTPEIALYHQLKNDEDLVKQSRGLEFWIHRTCYELKKRQSNIHLKVVDQVPDNGIIVFHKGYFPKALKPSAKQYFVCIQADYGRHRFAQMHIVQNQSQLNGFKLSRQRVIDKIFPFTSNVFMPHWPQPGVKNRVKSRGCKLENVGFFGNPEQFPQDDLEAIKTIVNEAGLNLQLKLTPEQWTDYSQTDIALALRGFGNQPYHNKPFSKVMNAVMAGSLVIAGNETANIYFQQRYYPELPVIKTLDDLKQTLKQVQQDPCQAFETLSTRQAGMNDLTLNSMTNSWEKILIEASDQLKKWQSNGVMRKFFHSLRSA